ncbi:MAG: glucose-6-phosphate isomerase [Verrucomicrobiota bacterium JB022]|nr:glucose-6-phosphate isomerase [Verrucomicrobiota bacterium JB022]
MSWNRFKEYYLSNPSLGFALDVSRMNFDRGFLAEMEAPMQQAFQSMQALEMGAIANPDENRMVGHYWLRNAEIAPTAEIAAEISGALERIESFARKIHSGEIQGEGGKFTDLLVIGIGGSALGPQFVAQALGRPGEDRMQVHFFDNTDPDGMDVALNPLRNKLDRTLVLVVSKSGGTPETRNGMLEAQQAYLSESVTFARHAVAVTGVDSKLDKVAVEEDWLERFPMWDWVGGRTSEMAAVGLLPARLQGIDIKGMLKGASKMDAWTRSTETRQNPAALLALMWYHATNGKGEKDMVILPYKDRLTLFAKYLQQLVMESLGKELDLAGKVVNQGIAVYGNKGSTDQHAYVQQLREGVNNFFATFIEVTKDREGASVDVEDGVTSGDYLNAFLLGTREALAEKDRESITITIDEVTPEAVGMLIALYERAVGFYASLVGINAYHQPGVEAGKKAAATFLKIKQSVTGYLFENAGQAFTVDELASAIGAEDQAETIYKLLQHLVANPAKGIVKQPGSDIWSAKYSAQA